MIKDFTFVSDKACSSVKIKSNFHTHNYLCGHAGGTVCDYVKEAVKCGMEIIGISDHCACPIGTYEPYMTLQTMRTRYLPQFEQAEKAYGGKIKILKGAEIEYFDGCDGYYRDMLSALDYLVLGQHEYMYGKLRCNSFCDGTDDGNIVAYCDNVKRGLRSGYFSVLAHPDLIFYRHPAVSKRVAAAFEEMLTEAKSYGVAVELNANGIRSHAFRYPTDLLISICRSYNIPVTVSSDAHSPEYLCDKYTVALYDYAEKSGLDIVTEIRIPEKK